MWKILKDRNGNKISTNILNLKNTLLNGQSFNWKIAEPSLEKMNDPNHRIEYIGYLGKKVLLLKEDYLGSDSKSLINCNTTQLNLWNKNEQVKKEKYVFYKFFNFPCESDSPEANKGFPAKDFQLKSTQENNKQNSFSNAENFKNKINITIIPGKPNNIGKLCESDRLDKSVNTAVTDFSTNKKAATSTFKEKESEEELLNNLILDYFQMEVNLQEILSSIAPKLPSHLSNVIINLEGVRIIKQEIFECTMSFICSSNNNIERIKKMLLALREQYGELILNDLIYGKIHAFPSLENLLSKTSEEKLRKLGFGYRAKYIINSLELISEKGIDWLYSLEKKEEPWKELVLLTGVGRKVADCISLFSLKKHKIVPLDIHMIKFYNETILKLNKNYKKIENLGKQVYEDVSKIYSNTFGDYAGWVHSVFYLNRVDKSKPDFLKENIIEGKSKKKKITEKKVAATAVKDPYKVKIIDENRIIELDVDGENLKEKTVISKKRRKFKAIDSKEEGVVIGNKKLNKKI